MKGEKFYYVLDGGFRCFLGLVLSNPVFSEEIEYTCDRGLVVPIEVIECYTGAEAQEGKIMIADVRYLKRYTKETAEIFPGTKEALDVL